MGFTVNEKHRWPVLRHTFSHFHLDISPVLATVKSLKNCVMEESEWVWYNNGLKDERTKPVGGFPTPVIKLLKKHQNFTDLSQGK